MRSSISDAKRANAVQDTASERWSRLYADVRASYGRAAIQAAILLNGGASVALLAFLGNLAIAQQTKGRNGELCNFWCGAITRHSESVRSIWYRVTGRLCCIRVVGVHMANPSWFKKTPWKSGGCHDSILFKGLPLTGA